MLIYKITNKINGKCYVGQTTGPLNRRWRNHLNPRSNPKTYISKAITKHGPTNFTIDVLSECSDLDTLNVAEKYFIDYFQSLSPDGYNLTTGGEGKQYSDESKKKMSLSRVGRSPSKETRLKMSENRKGSKNPFFGKKLSEEHKKKLREIHLGRALSEEHKEKLSKSTKGRKKSEATRLKMMGPKSPEQTANNIVRLKMMAAAQKGTKLSTSHRQNIAVSQCIPVVCLNTGVTYPSALAASKELGVYPTDITKVVKGKKEAVKGLRFAYLRDLRAESEGT